MNAKQNLRTLMILMILGSSIGCDQISKHIIRQNISYNEQINLLNNHLTITKIENTGAFLSLGNSLPRPVSVALLIILPLIVLALALIYLFTKSNLSNLMILGVCLAIGGGLGNIYDRVIHGSVTDFLYIDFGLFHTGILNMADVSVTAGVCVIVFETYFHQKKVSKLHNPGIIQS